MFEHYPASPDELIASSVALVARGDDTRSVMADVQAQTSRSMLAVEGDLEGALAGAPVLVLATGTDVEASAQFSAACLLFFAQAIIDYNAGIDLLNQELRAAMDVSPGTSVAELITDGMTHRKAQLDADLDDAADEAAAMLDRGPNPADDAYLRSQGADPFVPPPGPVTDSAWYAIGDAPGAAAVLSGTADPVTAAHFWASLSATERAALIRDRPDLVGRTSGLPVGARDEANRALLQRDVAYLSEQEANGTITEAERRRLDNARSTQQSLTEVESFPDPATGEPLTRTDPVSGDPMTAQLMIYEPAAFGGDGRGAVSVGNAETADNVAFVVPGIRTDMRSIPEYTEDGLHLYEQARGAAPEESTAVVVWVGYDAPELEPADLAADVAHDAEGPLEGTPLETFGDAGEVVSDIWGGTEQTVTPDMADAGGEQLASDVYGFQASRGGDDAHTTVIGHSYGSTTVAYAVGDHGMRPDAVVLLGSPGAGPVGTADELGIPQGSVYVGSASSDPVTYAGDQGRMSRGGLLGVVGLDDDVALGYDPAEIEFGAVRIGAELPGAGYVLDDHGAYLAPGSESLTNVAGIVVGDGPVTVVQPRDDTPYPWDLEAPWDPGPADPEWEREPQLQP